MDLQGLVSRFNRASIKLHLSLQIPLTEAVRGGNAPPISELNEWQNAFCFWMGERLGIGEVAMRQRLLKSMNAVRGGHGGGDFRRFCMLSYDLYLPFAADTREEVVGAYEFHTHMHFLRFMSYPLPQWSDQHPVMTALQGETEIAILDFGCGLAQNSITLARALKRQGKAVRLYLADVSRLQLDFLEWFCRREQLAVSVFNCTAQDPFPQFPAADVVIAEEVLEHVHDPLAYIEALNRMTAPSGFFLANLGQHENEFMHVSPDLALARQRLLALGYAELLSQHVFRKPGARSTQHKAAQDELARATVQGLAQRNSVTLSVSEGSRLDGSGHAGERS